MPYANAQPLPPLPDTLPGRDGPRRDGHARRSAEAAAFPAQLPPRQALAGDAGSLDSIHLSTHPAGDGRAHHAPSPAFVIPSGAATAAAATLAPPRAQRRSAQVLRRRALDARALASVDTPLPWGDLSAGDVQEWTSAHHAAANPAVAAPGAAASVAPAPVTLLTALAARAARRADADTGPAGVASRLIVCIGRRVWPSPWLLAALAPDLSPRVLLVDPPTPLPTGLRAAAAARRASSACAARDTNASAWPKRDWPERDWPERDLPERDWAIEQALRSAGVSVVVADGAGLSADALARLADAARAARIPLLLSGGHAGPGASTHEGVARFVVEPVASIDSADAAAHACWRVRVADASAHTDATIASAPTAAPAAPSASWLVRWSAPAATAAPALAPALAPTASASMTASTAGRHAATGDRARIVPRPFDQPRIALSNTEETPRATRARADALPLRAPDALVAGSRVPQTGQSQTGRPQTGQSQTGRVSTDASPRDLAPRRRSA